MSAAARAGVSLWESGKAAPLLKLDAGFRAGEDADRAALVLPGSALAAVAGRGKEIRLYKLPE